MSEFLKALDHAARQSNWDDYEELWLDAIEKETVPFPEFLQAAQRALSVNAGDRAGKVFELLGPQAGALGHKARRAFYETLVQCLPKQRPHRISLIDVYQEEYGEIEGFEACVKSAELKESKEPKEAIELFQRMINYQPGCFIHHKSGWGVGEILSIDPVEGAAMIDFEEKPDHRVLLEALPDIAKPLPAQHFLVLSWRQPEELRRLAQEEPIELLRRVLATSDRPVPLSRIRELLTGSVIPSPDWSKWWARQRNAIKQDPSIGVSGGRSSEFFLLDGPEAVAKSVERRLNGLDFKQRLRVLRELVDELSLDDRPTLQPHLEKLLSDLLRGDGAAEIRLEALLFLRREGGIVEELPDVADLIGEHDRLADALNTLTRQEDQKEIIEQIRSHHPDEWPDLHVELLLAADDGPREILLQLLEDAGRSAELDALAIKVRRVPMNAPMFFLWLVRCAASGGHKNIPSLEGTTSAELFRQSISLLDRLSLHLETSRDTTAEIRVKRFRHHLSGKPLNLLQRVMENSGVHAARNIYLGVQASRGFSSGAQQRVLAAILRAHPGALTVGKQTSTKATLDANVIYATDRGLQVKRAELEEIRNEKLPAIFKAIGDAAALGDLSENAEFTSAIEERENLNRRALELQSQLDRAQRIDPSEANLEAANLGVRVTLFNRDTDEQNSYALLGPWDGSPDEGVISYLSPIGQAVWQRKPGEEFEVELPSGTVRMRLEAISRYEIEGAGAKRS
ncbi:MAG: GreA/GreB family elongation factor [Planctomycetota bacterium]|jgi:transcription elongation GreA/GreB family factor